MARLCRYLFVFIAFCFLNFTFLTSAFADLNEIPSLILKGELRKAEEILLQLNKGNEIEAFDNCFTLSDTEIRFGELYEELPELREVEEIRHTGRDLSGEDYDKLKQNLGQKLRVKKEYTAKTLKAYQRFIEDLSEIKAHIKFDIKEEKGGDSEKNENDENDENKQDEQDIENPWDQANDQYKPRNKPFSLEGNSKKNKAILVETDAPLLSPLMGSNIFDVVTKEGWTKSDVGRRSPYKDGKYFFNYSILTYGQNNIPLPLPLGYRPIISKEQEEKGISIIENNLEEYILHYKGNEKRIDLKLVRLELNGEILNGVSFKRKFKEKYSETPTGIDQSAWPSDIKGEVARIKSSIPKSNHFEIAEALAGYIKKEYRYYSQDALTEKETLEVDSKIHEMSKAGYPMPVIFCTLKTIQCDGAAWIMVSLLRDFFKIPARVVSGRTAVRRGAHIVVRANDPLHAWIQVWDDNKGWLEVDATPKEKPSKEKKEEKKKKEKKKDKNKNGDKPINNDRDDKDDKDDTDDKDESHSNAIVDKDLGGESLLEKGGIKYDNYYFAEFARDRLAQAAQAIANPKEKTLRLLKVKKLLSEYDENYFGLISIDEEIDRLEFYETKNDDDFFKLITKSFDENKLTETYFFVDFIIRDFLFLKKYRKLTDNEEKFYNYLLMIKNSFNQIKSQDSESYTIVNELMKILPGPITRRIIHEKYGQHCLDLGHVENIKLAEKIKDGELDFFTRVGTTTKYSKILLKKSFLPTFEEIFIGDKSSRSYPIYQYDTIDNVFDLTRANLPVKSLPNIMEDFLSGRIEGPVYKEPIKLDTHKGRKINIVSMLLVDESFSMNGDRSRFAQDLVAAYVDRARKEVGEKLSHSIMVIPFTDRIGTPLIIKDDKDAMGYIKKVQASNGRDIMNGGTDIQEALVKAYEEIAKSFADSEMSSGLKKNKIVDLRKANIWLLTDGESSIDIEVIKKARAKVPKDVEIYLNVVFIGGINKSLKTYLLESNPDKARMIQVVKDQEIYNLINHSKSYSYLKKDQDYFATDKGRMMVNGSLIQSIRNLASFKSILKSPRGTIKDLAFDNKKILASLEFNEEVPVDMNLVSFLNFILKNKEYFVKENEYDNIVKSILIGIEKSGCFKKLDVVSFKILSQKLGDNL